MALARHGTGVHVDGFLGTELREVVQRGGSREIELELVGTECAALRHGVLDDVVAAVFEREHGRENPVLGGRSCGKSVVDHSLEVFLRSPSVAVAVAVDNGPAGIGRAFAEIFPKHVLRRLRTDWQHQQPA